MARMVLPQNMMTEWYWTGSLMAFARVCNLRNKPDSQEETRMINSTNGSTFKRPFSNKCKVFIR
jgi:thymidylate synthase ThyX